MTPEEFAAEMQKIVDRQAATGWHYQESDHSQADTLLCQALKDLGYGEGVRLWESIER